MSRHSLELRAFADIESTSLLHQDETSRVCLDLSSCIKSIVLIRNWPEIKERKVQSFILTFILLPCGLHPDEGFFYLCGNVKNSVRLVNNYSPKWR